MTSAETYPWAPKDRKPRDPRARRSAQMKCMYGITLDEYEAMLEQQGERCAICRRECASGRKLAVDHDHNTGRVRGLLCGNCNTALGKMGDSPLLLRAAADYLDV